MKSIKILALTGIAALMFGICGCSSKTMLRDKNDDYLKPDEIKVGKTVRFGDYHGAEKWIVLDIDDGKAMLISKDVVDVKQFDEDSHDWDKSDLRKWLNDKYFEDAFSDDEKECIVEEDDMVTILTQDEVKEYFEKNADRKAELTSYANKNITTSDSYCGWWLRTPASSNQKEYYVSRTGSITRTNIDAYDVGVRPVIWVEIGE